MTPLAFVNLPLWVVLFGLASIGCGDRVCPPEVPGRVRPTESDLLTLVPGDADLVVRVDLRQLRRSWRHRSWARAPFTRAVGGLLHRRLGTFLLQQADMLVLALWFEPNGRSVQRLLLVRDSRAGSPGLAQQARTLLRVQPMAPGKWGRHRGIAYLHHPRTGAALLTPRTLAAGHPTAVRRTVDLIKSLPGETSARDTPAFMALWNKVAPGLPLLTAVLRLRTSIRRGVARKLHLPATVRRAALRLEEGRFVNLEAFLDVQEPKYAPAVIQRLKQQAQELARSPLGQRLWLATLLTPLRLSRQGARVHVRWSLFRQQLDQHIYHRLFLRGTRHRGKGRTGRSDRQPRVSPGREPSRR